MSFSKKANTRVLAAAVIFFSTFSCLFSQKKLTDSTILKTVVIQATRASAQTPTPHTNFSAAEISKNYTVQDVPFLLSAVPSLVETSDAGVPIGYTGMRLRGSDQTRINVTINGIPLNDAESQQVFWVDLPDLAASTAEIQVQRGVGTSTHGAGAFGGAVNLDISKIDADAGAKITTAAGSFGMRRLSAQANTGLLRGHWAFAGRGSFLASDGFIDRASAALRSQHFSGAYVDDRQTVQAHFLNGHELTYQAWNGVPAQYVDVAALRTFNTAGTEKPAQPYDNQVDNYTQRHLLLHYKRQFQHGLALQLNGHYTRGFGFYEQYEAAEKFADYGLPDWQFGDTALAETDLVRQRWLDNHFYGSNFALQWAPPVNPPFFSRLPVFTLGGAWSRYEGRHFGEVTWAQFSEAFGERRQYYDNDAVKTDGDVFLKMEFSWKRGLTTFADLQIRHVGYQFLGFDQQQNNVTQRDNLLFFNPKLGFSKKISPRWTTHAFWGIANREPNRDDYTQSTPDSRPKSERLYDTETGLRWQSGGWSLSGNFFWMKYKNQLVLDGRLNDVGAYIRTNVPESQRVGVEIEAARKATERWNFAANLALSRNKAARFSEFLDDWDTGQQVEIEHRNSDLAFSPSVVGRGESGFIFLKKTRQTASLTAIGKHVGKQFLDNTSNENTALAAFFTLDFRLNWLLKTRSGLAISLLATVHNSLNTKYSSNGWTYRYRSLGFDERPFNPYTRAEGNGTYNQTGFFPQAGRHFSVACTVEF